MQPYEINQNRQEWVYTQFINNQNLLLDWERRSGKSIYSVTCILDYALNYPNTNHLIAGHDEGMDRLLLQKMVMCNFNRITPLVEKTLQNKIILKNQSVIYFGSKSVKKDVILNTLLIDELGEFNEYKNNFFRVLYHNKGCKLLVNCTVYDTPAFESTRRLFSKYKMPLCIDPYLSDEELSLYLRKKKIEKIKTTILK
jgi:hypothetical protein